MKKETKNIFPKNSIKISNNNHVSQPTPLQRHYKLVSFYSLDTKTSWLDYHLKYPKIFSRYQSNYSMCIRKFSKNINSKK